MSDLVYYLFCFSVFSLIFVHHLSVEYRILSSGSVIAEASFCPKRLHFFSKGNTMMKENEQDQPLSIENHYSSNMSFPLDKTEIVMLQNG